MKRLKNVGFKQVSVKDLEKVRRILNDIIMHSLSDPHGDPSWSENMTAAKALVALDALGIEPRRNRSELERTLRGENVHNEDFLALLGVKKKAG